MKTISLI